MDNAQKEKGTNPRISPSQKNLLNKIFFLIYKYGNSDTKGTKTRKVFIIKDKPIQLPKRSINSLLSLFLILTKENNPIVTKHE